MPHLNCTSNFNTEILKSSIYNPSKGKPWTRALVVHRSRSTGWLMSTLQRANFFCDRFVLATASQEHSNTEAEIKLVNKQCALPGCSAPYHLFPCTQVCHTKFRSLLLLLLLMNWKITFTSVLKTYLETVISSEHKS